MKRGNDLGTAIIMNGGFFVHKDLDLDAPIFRCIRFEHVFVNKKVLQKGSKKVSTFNTQ